MMGFYLVVFVILDKVEKRKKYTCLELELQLSGRMLPQECKTKTANNSNPNNVNINGLSLSSLTKKMVQQKKC